MRQPTCARPLLDRHAQPDSNRGACESRQMMQTHPASADGMGPESGREDCAPTDRKGRALSQSRSRAVCRPTLAPLRLARRPRGTFFFQGVGRFPRFPNWRDLQNHMGRRRVSPATSNDDELIAAAIVQSQAERQGQHASRPEASSSARRGHTRQARTRATERLMTAIGERAGPGTIRGLLEQGAYLDQINQRCAL